MMANSKRQIEPYTLAQYLATGCTALVVDGKLDSIGAGIYMVTNGMPCNGCNLIGNCKAFVRLTNVANPKPPATHGESVREEASRRGLSINEVRRRRRGILGDQR